MLVWAIFRVRIHDHVIADMHKIMKFTVFNLISDLGPCVILGLLFEVKGLVVPCYKGHIEGFFVFGEGGKRR